MKVQQNQNPLKTKNHKKYEYFRNTNTPLNLTKNRYMQS